MDNVHREFCHSFSEFGKIDKSLQLVSCPFTHDPETCHKSCSWTCLISNVTLLKERFNSLKLDEFYASLSAAKFPNIQKMAHRMLSDEHLRSVLRTLFPLKVNVKC